jgi:hypothetical protein
MEISISPDDMSTQLLLYEGATCKPCGRTLATDARWYFNRVASMSFSLYFWSRSFFALSSNELACPECMFADKHASYLVLFWPAALVFTLMLLIASVGVCEMAGLSFPSKYALAYFCGHVSLCALLTAALCRHVVRKYFHLIALVLFLPGFYFQVCISRHLFFPQCEAHPDAAGDDVSRVRTGCTGVRPSRSCRCAAFATRFAPRSLSNVLSSSAANFLRGIMLLVVDNRDAGILSLLSGEMMIALLGPVLLTHIYLLLGCALPLWLRHSRAPVTAAYAGLIATGVGDAVVCFCAFYLLQTQTFPLLLFSRL